MKSLSAAARLKGYIRAIQDSSGEGATISLQAYFSEHEVMG